METTKSYKAPWGKSVKFQTIGLPVIIAIVLFSHLAVTDISTKSMNMAVTLLVVVPVVVLPVIIALFMIRGYELTGTILAVKRSFWNTEINLLGLQSAEFVPDAMARSIRFGNSGFFAIWGTFQNNKLGSYKAFVTDTKRTVVLKFHNRKIVISPDNPEKFVEDVQSMITALRNGGDSNA